MSTRRPAWRGLGAQILLATALGVALGLLAPSIALQCKILGDIFLRLIRTAIAPLATNSDPATSGAQFSSNVGSGSGSFKASSTSQDLQQLAFTSAFIAFPNATNETASFSLSSLIPDFAVGTVTPSQSPTAAQAYPAAGTFNAAATGSFSSNPAPLNAIPEPASLVLLGGGMLGAGLVRLACAAKRSLMR